MTAYLDMLALNSLSLDTQEVDVSSALRRIIEIDAPTHLRFPPDLPDLSGITLEQVCASAMLTARLLERYVRRMRPTGQARTPEQEREETATGTRRSEPDSSEQSNKERATIVQIVSGKPDSALEPGDPGSLPTGLAAVDATDTIVNWDHVLAAAEMTALLRTAYVRRVGDHVRLNDLGMALQALTRTD